MLFTFRGRVESDPMRVPLAASMATGRDERFEQVLEQVVAADETRPVDDAAARARDDADAPAAAHGADDVRADEPAAAAEPAQQPAAGDEPAAPLVAGASAADARPDDTRRGEPVRQETAGKGADSPRTSKPTAEPLLAAVVQQQAGPGPAASAGTGDRAVAAVGAARAATAPARGADPGTLRPSAPLPAAATAGPYRTGGAASAQLLEQARDSVFKQILLRLQQDGGELRLRLEPPDLGELDLRLVVEGGNKLSLAIAAERPELAALLQRHLDELKQTLQQAGLEVTGASVQTRSEFAREQRARDQGAADDGRAPAAAEAAAEPTDRRPRGYVSATGLDFWV